MSLGWDDEAPRGFQDADIELAEFEAQADDLEEVDPFAGLPFGEQQREVDWLESRFDSSYELDPPEYDGPWDES